MPSFTPALHLPQWSPGEGPKREQFNEAFQEIDKFSTGLTTKDLAALKAEADRAEAAAKNAEAARKATELLKTQAAKDLQDIKASAIKELQGLKAQADKDFAAKATEMVKQVKKLNQETLEQARDIVKAGVAEAKELAEKALETSNELKDELRGLVDPTTGQVDELQQILYNIFNALAPSQITAGEYDALTLAADTYDGWNITAKDYDLKAKHILIGG